MNILFHPGFLALGAAVLHFLWQGTLLGLLAALLLRLSRGRAPEFRYGLGCLLLLAMVLVFGGTFLDHLPHTSSGFGTTSPSGGSLRRVALQEVSLAPLSPGLSSCLPWVAWGWGLGALSLLIRTGSGLLWLHVGIARRALPAPLLWQARLDALRTALGLARTVHLRVAATLDSLLVVGFLRPLILVPASALAGLTPDHLETILLHELSHIRRHDYLVNVLQVLAEALLFFHPAVWWLSREIRREREHCCDDAAVRRCGDPLRYASALAALEALRLPNTLHSHLAPAARGGSLMLRIQRILVPRPTASGTGFLPAFGLLALLMAIGAAGHHLQAHTPAPVTHPIAAPVPRLTPAPAPRPRPAAAALPLPQPAAPQAEPVPVRPIPSATVAVVAAAAGPAQPFDTNRPDPAAVEFFFQGVPAGTFKITSKPSTLPFPAEPRALGLQGEVVVAMILGSDGKPRMVKALSGPAAFLSAAEAYAAQWAFTAPTLDGEASEGRFLLTIVFKLS